MAARPDRSDPHLPPDEAARVEAQIRDYFDKITPKRPAKPPRSDPTDADTIAAAAAAAAAIPELDKLRHLEANPEKLVLDGGEEAEEYVETEYYDDLNCIDKQHHTTGTGFIKVEKPNGSSFNMTAVSCSSASLVRCSSNPATNDWVPSAEMVEQ